MKIKQCVFITMCFLLLLSGCGQPDGTSISPTLADVQYTAEDLFAIPDSKEVINLPEENPDMAEDTGEQENSDLPEYLKPQENIEYVKYDAANYPNRNDLIQNWRSMFCMDPDTGVAYYVNQNKDGYIYRIINGKAELVVELPARELHMLNGVLYFILMNSEEYEYKELAAGDIYAYVPAEGSVDLVFSPKELEGDIYRIFPYEDGMAFCNRVAEKEIKIDEKGRQYYPTKYDYYYYSFTDALLEADSYKRAVPGWGSYYLTTAENENGFHCELWSRENNEEGKLDIEVGNNGFVIENTLYTFSRGRCQTDNLLTEEKKTFDINAIFEEKMPQYMEYLAEAGTDENYKLAIDGTTVNKDGIWMIVQFYYLLHLDPETGETECYRIGGSKYINDLYTDGINLYGTYGSLPSLCKYDGKPVRICIEEIVGRDSMSDIPVIAVEYLTD